MFKKWRTFLAKHQGTAEDSVEYRVGVTVLVMFALLLTLHQLEWPGYWSAIMIITPLASVLSYRRRASNNVWLKIFLSFAMVALLLWFFVRLSNALYDPRLPLAELLIWLQTLHAFDLPAKKDLRYTALVALILMAIACVLTYSSYFGTLLLFFCVLFLAVLAVDYWSDNRTARTVVHRNRTGKATAKLDLRWLGRAVTYSLPLALLGAGLIFLFMPRYQGLRLRSLPVSWDMQFNFGQVSSGEILNQSLNDSNDSGGKPQRIDGDSYFGFDSKVNLNARGQLSDRLVLKVRTSHWQYHRGVTFSDYTGYGWNAIPWEPAPKSINQPPFAFRSINFDTEDRVTIYYSETDLPNIIFTPSNPHRLYFPSNNLYCVNSFPQRRRMREVANTPATLVAPVYLETGLVYSVLNRIPPEGTHTLSRQRIGLAGETPDYLQPYLQLPPTVTQRTRELAQELIKKQTSSWGKASALTAYLQQNYKYNLEVGFYPEKADTADHFLFEAKEGYCEQFATSLCVLARSVGLPARYVTGYLPGKFNPVSGFYEVRASDAHAWAEIYLEEYGWLIFDPVPGENATPQLGDSEESRWLMESILEYLEVPESVRQALPALMRAFVGLAVLTLLLALFRGRRSPSRQALSSLAPYLRRAESLTAPRQPGETVSQWALRLAEWPQLRVLADVYEATFYRDRPVSGPQFEQLEAMLRELRAKADGKAH